MRAGAVAPFRECDQPPAEVGSRSGQDARRSRRRLSHGSQSHATVTKHVCVLTAQGNLSRHLQVLEDAGLCRHREGICGAAPENLGADHQRTGAFAAAALVAPDIKAHLVDALANELTAGSLQSPDELKRVAVFLGANPKKIVANEDSLKQAFHARNQIIHEMDIDFSQ